MTVAVISTKVNITEKPVSESNPSKKESEPIQVSCFDEACAYMAKNSYKEYDLNLKGCKEITEYACDDWNGFRAKVYAKDGKIIIAYAGTDSIGDYFSDLQMALGFTPLQYDDAMELYLKVSNDPRFEGKEIYVVGHSLGGSLAQLVASTEKYNGQEIKPPKAITFNAYGQKKLIDEEDDIDDKTVFVDKHNTKNYFIQGDYVSGNTKNDALENQPGTVILFDDEIVKKDTFVESLIAPLRRFTLRFGGDREDSLSKYHTIEHFVEPKLADNFQNPIVLRNE